MSLPSLIILIAGWIAAFGKKIRENVRNGVKIDQLLLCGTKRSLRGSALCLKGNDPSFLNIWRPLLDSEERVHLFKGPSFLTWKSSGHNACIEQVKGDTASGGWTWTMGSVCERNGVFLFSSVRLLHCFVVLHGFPPAHVRFFVYGVLYCML